MNFQPTDPVFHEMVHPYARGGAKQVRRDKVDFPLRYFAPYFEIAFYLAILGAPDPVSRQVQGVFGEIGYTRHLQTYYVGM